MIPRSKSRRRFSPGCCGVGDLHSTFGSGTGPAGGDCGGGGRVVRESGRTKSQNQKPPEKPIVKGKEMGVLLGKLLLAESCFGSLSRQRARGACPDPEFPGEPVTPQSCFLGVAAFLSITFSARWHHGHGCLGWMSCPLSSSSSPYRPSRGGVCDSCHVGLASWASDRAPVPPQCGGHRPGCFHSALASPARESSQTLGPSAAHGGAEAPGGSPPLPVVRDQSRTLLSP